MYICMYVCMHIHLYLVTDSHNLLVHLNVELPRRGLLLLPLSAIFCVSVSLAGMFCLSVPVAAPLSVSKPVVLARVPIHLVGGSVRLLLSVPLGSCLETW